MIPDYQTIMLPLLKIMSDKKTHRLRELIEILAIHFHLNDDERKELLPSGAQAIFDNRVGWAKFYLEKANLLKTEKRGSYYITELGLNTIYIQAKRWENSVPVREIRDFAGALMSKKARKGIFITTSSFPQSAFDFVESIEHKIILIDGKRLTSLMFEFNVGLSTQSIYELKRIDSDYFEE